MTHYNKKITYTYIYSDKGLGRESIKKEIKEKKTKTSHVKRDLRPQIKK